MIAAIDIVGDHAHIASTISAYRAAGVDHPIVMPLPWGADRNAVVEATLAAAAEG